MRGIARIQPGWGITAVRVGMAAIFIVAGYHKFAVGLGGLISSGLTGWHSALAQSGMYVYPKKGQSREKQSRDKWECHNWGVEQTGYDPSAPQGSIAARKSSKEKMAGGAAGSGVKGAVRGAAMGGITGGNVGQSAATGAGIGRLRARIKRRRAEQQRKQQEQEQQRRQQQQLAHYQRAYTACMEGRDYTVK